jgi:hypothetical protein
MLRSIMYDINDKDKNFIAMMHDFVESHRDRPATTESFKAIIEKHMNKVMDIQGNGRLDWFFDEWVYFAMPVPVFADFGSGMVRLGQVGMAGNTTRNVDILLPSQPKKVAFNAYKEILER